MKDKTRNLNPHKPARIAMILYSDEYRSQGDGSMDFWDSLPSGCKRTCRDIVKQLEKDRPESKAEGEGL